MEYFDKKMLSTLGHTFRDEDLTVFDVSCYQVIANEISKLEEQEMKKARKKK
jgi:hypothetical protein